MWKFDNMFCSFRVLWWHHLIGDVFVTCCIVGICYIYSIYSLWVFTYIFLSYVSFHCGWIPFFSFQVEHCRLIVSQFLTVNIRRETFICDTITSCGMDLICCLIDCVNVSPILQLQCISSGRLRRQWNCNVSPPTHTHIYKIEVVVGGYVIPFY